MTLLSGTPLCLGTLPSGQFNQARGQGLPAQFGRGQRYITTPNRRCAAKCELSSSAKAESQPTTKLQRLAAFAASASGEWDGVTASFGADGEKQALPDYYVPQAFRDWGVTLYDWQSNCSMHSDGEGRVRYVQRRMMPTVGCEADAVAFTSQEQQFMAAAATPDGCYSFGPSNLGDVAGEGPEPIEHCLVLAPEQRVRVVHQLKRAAAGGWCVGSIEVHHERLDAPYNGRGELTGCGGGMEPFAEKSALEVASLVGAWVTSQGATFSFDELGNCTGEADASGQSWSASAAEGAVFLPIGIWSSARLSEGDASIEVGVLVSDTLMRTACRKYRGGRLSSVSLQTLVRQ